MATFKGWKLNKWQGVPNMKHKSEAGIRRTTRGCAHHIGANPRVLGARL